MPPIEEMWVIKFVIFRIYLCCLCFGQIRIEIREKKDRVEDALYATKAALAEGIVPGGGSALFQASIQHHAEESIHDAIAYGIVQKAIQSPFKKILENAGVQDWYTKLPNEGDVYDAKNHKMVNALEAGIIDPAKVVITALRNAASVAGTILTTESVVFEKKDKEEKTIPAKYWMELPKSDHEKYNQMMREARISMTKEGFYDPKMMALLKKIRCKFDPSLAECSNNQETGR